MPLVAIQEILHQISTQNTIFSIILHIEMQLKYITGRVTAMPIYKSFRQCKIIFVNADQTLHLYIC